MSQSESSTVKDGGVKPVKFGYHGDPNSLITRLLYKKEGKFLICRIIHHCRLWSIALGRLGHLRILWFCCNWYNFEGAHKRFNLKPERYYTGYRISIGLIDLSIGKIPSQDLGRPGKSLGWIW